MGHYGKGNQPYPHQGPRSGLRHLSDENGDIRLREVAVHEPTVGRREALERGDEVPDAKVMETGHCRETECAQAECAGVDGRSAGDAKRIGVQQHFVNRARPGVRGRPKIGNRDGDLAGDGRHEPDVTGEQTAAKTAVRVSELGSIPKGGDAPMSAVTVPSKRTIGAARASPIVASASSAAVTAKPLMWSPRPSY